MSRVTYIQQDLCQLTEGIIVQQLNCIAIRPHGLSADLVTAFPYCDVYGQRRAVCQRNLAIMKDRSQPGTISVSVAEDKKCPIIIGLYGQYYMGKSNIWGKHYASIADPEVSDTALDRERWFIEALEILRIFIDLPTIPIYFPDHIGCGLAGGNWSHYRGFIEEFATKISNPVFICQKS